MWVTIKHCTGVAVLFVAFLSSCGDYASSETIWLEMQGYDFTPVSKSLAQINFNEISPEGDIDYIEVYSSLRYQDALSTTVNYPSLYDLGYKAISLDDRPFSCPGDLRAVASEFECTYYNTVGQTLVSQGARCSGDLDYCELSYILARANASGVRNIGGSAEVFSLIIERQGYGQLANTVDQLSSALGYISSIEEALLLITADGYFWSTADSSIGSWSETIDGYLILAASDTADCIDTPRRHLLRVQHNGDIIVERSQNLPGGCNGF